MKNTHKLVVLFLLTTFLYSCNKKEDEVLEPDVTITPIDENRYKEKVFTEFTAEYDLTYGNNTTVGGNEKDLKFSIFQPKNDDLSKRPLLILVPGGSFTSVGTKYMEDYAREYVKYGYVCAVIDYRILDGGIPSVSLFKEVAIQASGDLKAAIRFFNKDAQTDNLYKIDTEKVFVLGHSAGAITALNTASIDNEDTFDSETDALITKNGGIEGNSGNDGYPSAIKGIINLAGAIIDTNLIDSKNPPMLSIHGDDDDVIPYEEGMANGVLFMYGSLKIHERAEEIGIQSTLKTIVDGDHSAPVAADCEDCTSTIIEFIYNNL